MGNKNQIQFSKLYLELKEAAEINLLHDLRIGLSESDKDVIIFRVGTNITGLKIPNKLKNLFEYANKKYPSLIFRIEQVHLTDKFECDYEISVKDE